MPSATAGGWPYPLPTEPTRDGAANIKALADDAQSRFGPDATVGMHVVAAFDVNGLWYAPTWASWGITWSQNPVVTAMAGGNGLGGDAGFNIQIYQPHNSAGALVLQGNYVKDGRTINGAIDVYIIAVGYGRRA